MSGPSVLPAGPAPLPSSMTLEPTPGGTFIARYLDLSGAEVQNLDMPDKHIFQYFPTTQRYQYIGKIRRASTRDERYARLQDLLREYGDMIHDTLSRDSRDSTNRIVDDINSPPVGDMELITPERTRTLMYQSTWDKVAASGGPIARFPNLFSLLTTVELWSMLRSLDSEAPRNEAIDFGHDFEEMFDLLTTTDLFELGEADEPMEPDERTKWEGKMEERRVEREVWLEIMRAHCRRLWCNGPLSDWPRNEFLWHATSDEERARDQLFNNGIYEDMFVFYR